MPALSAEHRQSIPVGAPGFSRVIDGRSSFGLQPWLDENLKLENVKLLMAERRDPPSKRRREPTTVHRYLPLGAAREQLL